MANSAAVFVMDCVSVSCCIIIIIIITFEIVNQEIRYMRVSEPAYDARHRGVCALRSVQVTYLCKESCWASCGPVSSRHSVAGFCN